MDNMVSAPAAFSKYAPIRNLLPQPGEPLTVLRAGMQRVDDGEEQELVRASTLPRELLTARSVGVESKNRREKKNVRET